MTATLCIPLDADHLEAVRALRVRLGAPEDAPPQRPHVSLLVVIGEYDLRALADVPARLASPLDVCHVLARDLGVFVDGASSPVIHVPVVRSPALSRLHQSAFDAVVELGCTIEGRSHPDRWMPHITLWRDTLTPELLGAALVRYASGPSVAWRLRVDRLAWLDDAG